MHIFVSKILTLIKPYTYGYQIKAQYLLVPKVQIRIRIFRICLRLGVSVYIYTIDIFTDFIEVTSFRLYLWGFDPTTLGVEAQVSYHLGHRGKVGY